MITFGTSFTEIGFDETGSVDEVPLNSYLRSVHLNFSGVGRNTVMIMDSSGNYGNIYYANTDFTSSIALYNYLLPFTLINKPQTKKIEISAAQLMACNSVPIELVAAPGIGLIICPHTLGYKYNYRSVIFDFAQNLYVHTDNKTETDAFFSLNKGIINAVASRSGVISNIIPAGVSTADSFSENRALILKAMTSDATTGDGNLTLYITYSIVEEPWHDGVYYI